MLWFDNHQIMRTPNYYVQRLFMEHQGSVLLTQEIIDGEKAVKLSPFAEHLTGSLILSGDESVATFSNIAITNLETGERREIPGTIRSERNEEKDVGLVDWANYSISLQAKELDGWKGFRICFAGQNAENRFVWSLGGWDNSSSLISEFIHGKGSVLTMKERHIEQGRSYRLEIRVQGRTIETFVDGEPETAVQSLPPLAEPLYAISSREGNSGDVIVKLVNVLPNPQPVTVELEGMTAATGTAYIMSGYDREAQNVLGEAETVVPREEPIAFDTGTFGWTVPEKLVCILRLRDSKK